MLLYVLVTDENGELSLPCFSRANGHMLELFEPAFLAACPCCCFVRDAELFTPHEMPHFHATPLPHMSDADTLSTFREDKNGDRWGRGPEKVILIHAMPRRHATPAS